MLNIDKGYVARCEDFEFVPGIIDVLRSAQDQGYRLIVVTNQSGIARGFFSQEDYAAFEEHMVRRFADHGITFTGIYYCPHHRDGVVREFASDCTCRKPEPGLIIRAAQDHDVDLSRSILIGDKPSDVEAGRAAGVRRLFLVPSNGDEVNSFKEVIAELASSSGE